MAALPRFAPLATFCLALTALTAPAFAGGPTAAPEETPVAEATPAPTGHDWSGPYLGLAASSPLGSTAWYTSTFGGGGYADEGDWENTQGVLSLGYNIQRGQMVYGVELSYSSGDVHAETATSNPHFTCAPNICETKVSDLIELRGRAGRTMGRSLFYVSGGLASAKTEAIFGVFDQVLGEDRLNGISVGVGIEYAVSARTSLKAEYSRVKLGKLDIPADCENCSVTPEFGSFRLGLNINF